MTWMRQPGGIENSLHWIRDVTFRRRPSQGTYRKRRTGPSNATQHRDQSAPPQRRRQHRRSLPDHRFDRQPPPRPPQSTIPQLTSLLINNAGALGIPAAETRGSTTTATTTRASRTPAPQATQARFSEMWAITKRVSRTPRHQYGFFNTGTNDVGVGNSANLNIGFWN
ncbi:transposase family protein, partial [Mycobacterium ulcerans str. Harvey]